jgi:hypothetical protein
MKWLYLLLLLPILAFADDPPNCWKNPQDCVPPEPPTTDIDVDVDAHPNSNAQVELGMNNNYENSFFALSTGFPQASNCFGGAQGGGGNKNSGGLFGVHILNKQCWLDQLAEAEKSLDIRARLKCGEKSYRKAITFDTKGNTKEKTQACINFITPLWKEEIKQEKCKIGTCAYINGVLSYTED